MPPRRGRTRSADVHNGDREKALGTLNVGEVHHARSAPIAEDLPKSIMSTPSVSAGLEPVF